MFENKKRKLKLNGVAGGLGVAALVMGGPFAAFLAYGAGYIIADKQLPDEDQPWKPVNQLLYANENQKLEYKECLFDKKGISKGIIKTISGFANAKGGNLLVGVNDAGEPVGINLDIKKFKSLDKLELALRDCISKNIAPNIAKYYRFRFENLDGMILLRIEVNRSPQKVFIKNEGHFYMRAGNQTKSLSAQDFYTMHSDDDNNI